MLALGKTEAEYDAWLIDISSGDQFGSYEALQVHERHDASDFD
tara:strand:- start:57553 stop:57681 length:129 start_codon:yes stop_codon:yes gene_type:complete